MSNTVETIQEAVFSALIALPAKEISNLSYNALTEAIDETAMRARAAVKVRDMVKSHADALTIPLSMNWLTKAANTRDLHSEITKRLFYRLHVIEHDGETWAGCTDGFRLHALQVDLPVGVYLFWGNEAIPDEGAEPVDWAGKVNWEADQVLPEPVITTPEDFYAICEWSIADGKILHAEEADRPAIYNKRYIDDATGGMVMGRTKAGTSGSPKHPTLTMLSGSRLAMIMAMDADRYLKMCRGIQQEPA